MTANLVGKTQRLLGFLGRSSLSRGSDAADGLRALLAETMPSCPVCGQQMPSHQYQPVARSPIGADSQESFHSMLEAARSHRWKELKDFQQWEATSADAEVFLFKCADGRYNLAIIYCPYDLGDIYKLMHQEQLQAEDLPISGDNWMQV